nr:EOG090X04O4 [Lepidurus arcticus]
MARYLTLAFAIFCLGGLSVKADKIERDILIKNADRAIDLSSQLVKINSRLTVQNNGKNSVNYFLYGLEPQSKNNLAFIGAQEGKEKPLTITETTVDGKAFWKIEFREPLSAGQSIKVKVETVFTHQLKPHPAEITQREKQLVRYYGNHYLYSPYKVASQTTKVVLSTSNIESYSKLKPTAQNDNTITYGAYENIEPFTIDEMLIHYESNAAFLSVVNYERHVELSHWGNIAIEETIDIEHTGAKLKGSFSRYEYQKDQGIATSVKAFKTILPAAAADVYYRDEIGNISTSHLREADDAVEIELRPRFPLFGGWKTHYVLGYNVPSYEYLFQSGEQHVLAIRLIDHIHDDMHIAQAHVRIVLPEGAHDIQVETPYPVQRDPNTLHFTYLDTRGRPMIHLRASNLVENHIQDVKVSYRYSKILMLQEPLLLVAAFFLVFLAIIIWVRLDFSLTKSENKKE